MTVRTFELRNLNGEVVCRKHDNGKIVQNLLQVYLA
jgi:hypothetical protein